MIDAAASGECDTCLNFVCFDKSSIAVLNLIADVHKLHARLNDGLSKLSDLSVCLGRLSQCLIIMSEETLLFAEFGIGCTLAIVIARVLQDFTLWELAVGELLPDRDHRWV